MSWIQPKEKGTKPGPRSGHSITCTHEKAIVFGGCGVQGGKSAVFNETYVLHIADQFRWELAEVTGDVPLPRWRHTVRHRPPRPPPAYRCVGRCECRRHISCCHLSLSQRRSRRRRRSSSSCSRSRSSRSLPPAAVAQPWPHPQQTTLLCLCISQATLLPDSRSILVFGGLCKGRRFNSTHIFDVDTREWRDAEVAGTPPHPRSHHTATLVEFDEEEDGEAEKKIFVIGGYGGPGSSRDFTMDVRLTIPHSLCLTIPHLATPHYTLLHLTTSHYIYCTLLLHLTKVHALDLDNWCWSKIERIKGPAPKPRADHAVRLILQPVASSCNLSRRGGRLILQPRVPQAATPCTQACVAGRAPMHPRAPGGTPPWLHTLDHTPLTPPPPSLGCSPQLYPPLPPLR